MKNQNIALSAFGASRATHAAAIAMAPQAREEYAVNHDALFKANGLKKYVAIDSNNNVLATNSDQTILHKEIQDGLYTNASSLRHEDFLTIQEVITSVRRRKLNGIADLMAAGLTFPASISDQIIGTENVSEFTEAGQDQNPTGTDNDGLVFGEIYVPNPITHKGFSVPWRQQGFSYKTSLGLSESVRMVSERLEETLFNGNDKISVNFNGQSQKIYGYTTHPKRGTATISDWSDVTKNDLIVNEVIANIGQMFKDQGGVEMSSICLYYPKNFKEAMDRDYSTLKGDMTVKERLMKIPEIKDIKFAEKLADKNVVYVELSARTVQLGVASDIVSVPHTKTNPMQDQAMTTYAAMVQIIKEDANGNTGILHATAP